MNTIFENIIKSFQIAVPIELFKEIPKEPAIVPKGLSTLSPKIASLSGQLSTYDDMMNRWRLSVPIECKIEKGTDKSTVLWTFFDLLLIFVEVTIAEDNEIDRMCIDIREKAMRASKNNKKVIFEQIS